MFDEPNLENILLICAEHKGRIVRDCQKLIREFQNGRQTLGRIANIHDHIERFRALDLDPRRAEEKAKEEAKAAKEAAEKMEALYEKLDALEEGELEDFAWEHISHDEAVEFQEQWTEKFEHLNWSDETEYTGIREAILTNRSVGFRWHAARALADRNEEGNRTVIENALEEVLDKASLEPGTDLTRELNMLLTESVIGLINLPEAASSILVFDKLLRHPNREVKGAVLRRVPTSEVFIGAMQSIVNERYGWQESAAQEWLDTNAPGLQIERPGSVHPDAWWDEDDKEWVIGEKDKDGVLQGIVKYWRPDGTLISEETLTDDKSYGPYTRYHETGEISRKGVRMNNRWTGKDTAFRASGSTTERAFPSQADARIHSIETYWKDGKHTYQIMRDSEGNQLDRSGDPIPTRPDSVPENAVFQTDEEIWEYGGYDNNSEKIGKWTYYNSGGELLREEEY